MVANKKLLTANSETITSLYPVQFFFCFFFSKKENMFPGNHCVSNHYRIPMIAFNALTMQNYIKKECQFFWILLVCKCCEKELHVNPVNLRNHYIFNRYCPEYSKPFDNFSLFILQIHTTKDTGECGISSSQDIQQLE